MTAAARRSLRALQSRVWRLLVVVPTLVQVLQRGPRWAQSQAPLVLLLGHRVQGWGLQWPWVKGAPPAEA